MQQCSYQCAPVNYPCRCSHPTGGDDGGQSCVCEESVVVPTVNGDIAYLHDATIKDMRSIMKDVSEIARAKGLSDYHYDSSNDDDEGGDLSQAPVIRQRTMTPLEESWADGDTARHRDEMIRDMRMLMADVLEVLRMDPSFAHSVSSRLINIYETAEKIMKRWSCYRIDGIASRPYDMTEVRSALPSESGLSLTTPLNCEAGAGQNSALLHMPANSPLQVSQFGASPPEHQFDTGAMEVDNPFPETSPGGGHTGQCSYDQGQGSDGDESTDEEECDGLD
ncbi:uncharacterized protein LOC123445546 [Hordeum vulgare subsp. vulgare]|uniref:uncharacterized protein LOC123445546 n=1 Tax=Hordeum vulgare subsp. vulgare TaxID=112509 RepID=UPI001D1A5702|nr:uncharacterized protein LOC123445546 [Hordeum vulgare subsp. vulgare]